MSKKTTTSGKAAAAAAEAQAKRNRTRTIMIIAVFAVVVIAGVAIFLAKRTPSTPSSDIVAPAGVTADLGIPVGTATTPVVDLYEDFQCPVCGAFEANIAPTLEQMAQDGQVKIIYHIMSFLDINLSNDSSARAANAAGCAQDQDTFLAYHNMVYANQPNEGVGYTDAELVAYGLAVGIPDMATFQQCVTNDTFGAWVDQMEINSEQDNVTSTPTIKLNGQELNWQGNATTWEEAAQNLVDAINAAS